MWEDDQGNALKLSAERFASLLKSHNLHAVVLHGCETARNNALTQVHGLAHTLAQEGLPAVLAQQANFTYESSQLASQAWYKALVAGQSMASALLAVRQALSQAERPDWAVPVLQGSIVSLEPVIDTTSIPGPADPLLTSVGAAADLSTPTDVFVGRHRELRTLHLILEDLSDTGPVLVVITGPGGIGKSTLATQAVNRYGGMDKAALLLRCQEYQSIDLFLQAIGAFLKRLGTPRLLEDILPDPKLSTETRIDEAIFALNTVGPVLLIIDNLESVQNVDQMISDTSLLYLLQRLLTNLQSGRVLITSRSMLKEQLLQELVGSKLLHLSLEDLSPYETSQLVLRYPPLARLSEIVRQMLIREFGGLPYVYNLLSSKAAVEDLEQIIYEMREYGAWEQKMITQESKQRTAEEWQKIHAEIVEFATLGVIINRLSEASRTLLAQLGVLQRPFPLAAIEQGLEAANAEWQPLLDWSLLHYDHQEKSYHLHNLTRRYVEDLLEEQARKQVQMQLASWYESYARRESRDLADYLEAHRLLRAAGSVQQAGRLVMDLAEVLNRYGLYPLLRDLCATIVSDNGDKNENIVNKAFFELGNINYLQGHYKQAQGFYQQSLDILEHLGDQYGQGAILHQLGMIAQDQGEYGEARRLYQQSLAMRERSGHKEGQGPTLHQLGMIAQDQGKYGEARRLYQQGLEIFEQLGDQKGRANSLHELGRIAENQGEYEQARGFYQQSLEIFERLGDQSGKGANLHNLGMIARRQGEYEQAREFYQQSLEIFERLGDQKGQAHSLDQLGHLAQKQGEYEQAEKLCQQSLVIFERLGDRNGQASILGQLGELAYQQEDFERALMSMIQAYILFDALQSPARSLVEYWITRIRNRIGEEVFARQWRQFARNHPLPSSEVAFTGDLNDLCNEVVTTLRAGDADQRDVVATRIEQMLKSDLFMKVVQDFLVVLLAWLHEQDTQLLVERLQSPFREIHAQMVTAVTQEAGRALTLEDLPDFVSSVILQGTAKQCQQLIEDLLEAQRQLPPEAASVERFLGCLVAALRRETPEVALLEPPFTDLWQAFQDALNRSSDESSQQKE